MKTMWKTSWFLGLVYVGFIFAANGQSPSDEEKGKKLVVSMCASCHEVTGWVHSKEDWEFIVPDMAGKGGEAPNAADAKLMVAYLTKHFGAGQDPSGSQASSDDEKGKNLLERTCVSCHQAGPWMHSKGEWEGVVLEHPTTGGSNLTEDEMRLLVTYLTKNFGPPKSN